MHNSSYDLIAILIFHTNKNAFQKDAYRLPVDHVRGGRCMPPGWGGGGEGGACLLARRGLHPCWADPLPP